ncbi:hypothetical protein QMK54_13440 [Pseudomonas sp. P5_109]|uniref:hypothetical protein n=1 Tax=Pseudomonas sp. P5_109 TaxID=3043441 RepID=UPI002A36FB18|nr:hypothetical protein [Pseudomonas sp. P5_109]WPN32684.1 hypothetical protein QMK54_13440 [Pseudomonas sp. P5_109]
MSADIKTTANGNFVKISTRQSTPTQSLEPKPVAVEHGLTVFLGGAGMVGAYNNDMISAFKEVGISNAISGNYSSLTMGMDRYVPELVDMLSDASSVVLYNQDEKDPVVLEYGELQKCEYGNEYIEKKYLFGMITVKNYNDAVCTPLGDLLAMKISRDVSKLKATEFPLSVLQITKPLPKVGQFNIVGYSWGAVIAARSAIYYARAGIRVDHLVLIGAPINKSLKVAVTTHPNIGNATIIDLKDKGDPIYAGISDEELMKASAELGAQMLNGGGHFYYSGENAEGKSRRRDLAKFLYAKGLR